MGKKGRVALVLIPLVLFTACNFPAPGIGADLRQEPAEVALSIGETIAALKEPAQAELGVWSLLANLGIGVYTPDGRQIMPGSERGEGEFWLYDFEVPALAAMAGGDAAPFGQYAEMLVELGYPGTTEALLATYRRIYAQHADNPLVQILEGTGLKYSEDASLTPLQEWLLLLDTFVPPNGAPGSAIGTGGVLRRAAGLPPDRRRQGICGEIRGGNLIPYWGTAWTESDLAAIMAAHEAYLAIHGPMLAQAADISLEASRQTAHEGHEGKGDRLEYTLKASASYHPLQAVPVGGISCGVLVDLNWRPIEGGLEGVFVEWEIPGAILGHAEQEEYDAVTDAQGEAKVAFRLVEEQARGIGPYEEESGSVRAYVQLRNAFLMAGIQNPRLLDFVPERRFAGKQPVTVSWHDLCEGFVVWFAEELHQQAPFVSQDILIEGPVMVDIYPEESPARLEGSASLPVSGGGKAGDCSFQTSGMDSVSIRGTASPGEGKDPPKLHMIIEHTMQIQIRGDQCGGGMPAPVPSGPSELEMPLRDGAWEGGEWSQPTVSGVTTYEIELRCNR